MKITLSIEKTGDFSHVDVPESLTLEDFQAYVQAETGIEPQTQILIYNSKTIDTLGPNSKKTLDQLTFEDGMMIILREKKSTPPAARSSGFVPAGNNDESIEDRQLEISRQQMLNDPQMASTLPPHVREILNNPQKFKEMMRSFQQDNYNNSNELRRLQDNPDDPDNQKKILEMIRQEQIEKNMNLAWEISPESFTQVDMLYINMKVDGHPVKAFVDTGAQMTLIDPSFAEKVGLDRLIDRRFKSVAQGVGTQLTQGKIHSVPISIGDSDITLPCLFTVLETGNDVLLGLDMMRRYKCIVDLERSCLVFGGNIEAKFLNGPEIPQNLGALRQKKSGLGGNIFAPGAINAPQPSGVKSGTSTSTSTASTKAGAAAASRYGSKSGSNNTSSVTPLSSSSHSEAKISQLVGLGFSKQEAISALDLTNGDVEMAAALLFG